MTEPVYVAFVDVDGTVLIKTSLNSLAGNLGPAIVQDVLRRAMSLANGNTDDWQPVSYGGHTVEAHLDDRLAEYERHRD